MPKEAVETNNNSSSNIILPEKRKYMNKFHRYLINNDTRHNKMNHLHILLFI